MSAEIQFTDLKINYISIAEARKRSGLRLVLSAYAAPGPWREACKGLFYVKGIPYASVVTANEGANDVELGLGGTQSDLFDWTAQSSAPVAIWNDERPRSCWIEQLMLAERLEPEPPLIPDDIEQRMRMFGLINEIVGENGLGWTKRASMVHEAFKTIKPGDDGYEFWEIVGSKYGYSPAKERAAPARMVAILDTLDRQLTDQQDRGRQYLIGDRLSALDIYCSTFLSLFAPLPPELCPMATSFRPACTNRDPEVAKALMPRLLAHRDFIYNEHLELPIVF
jgi:glutathione S-transferase